MVSLHAAHFFFFLKQESTDGWKFGHRLVTDATQSVYA